MSGLLVESEVEVRSDLENRLRDLFVSDSVFSEWMERGLDVFGGKTPRELLEDNPELLEKMIVEVEFSEYT